MFANLLLAAAFEVGPFYEQRADFVAFRPFWSETRETTDVLWPVFTKHRDWWRFCWFVNELDEGPDAYQLQILPIWFNGRTRSGEDYWGLFPLWGHHPHFLDVYDFDFCLWPVWHRYRTRRPSENRWMTSTAVLFPFVTWRDDGSWGVWPLAGVGHRRESDHRYCLWPLVTWADYRADRDTGGAGSSWMFWPVCGGVTREREDQWLFLPPLFSYVETRSPSWCKYNSAPEMRLRCPWPIVEIERTCNRSLTSVFPFYENILDRKVKDGSISSEVTRYGWRLVELYRDEKGGLLESRVFPFWKQNATHTRVWPFYESFASGGKVMRSVLALFPITWVDSVDRNWAKFWTFYESLEEGSFTDHSLFWGIIRWRTSK